MGFQKFEDKDRGGLDRDPALTISTKAGDRAVRGYFNAAAIREWFQNARHVCYHVDSDESRLGIDRTNKDDDSAYKLTFKGGATAALGGPLAAFGIDIEEAEGSWNFDLDRENGLTVADISELVEDLTDDVHCPECGRRYKQADLKGHITRVHENPQQALEEMDPDELGGSVPEGDDSWQDIDAKAGGQS